MSRAQALLRPHGFRLTVALVAAIVGGALPAASVLLVQQVVDRLLVDRDPTVLVLVALAAVGLPMVEGGLLLVRTHCAKAVAWSVAAGLRERLYEAWLRLGTGGEDTGTRVAAMMHEVDEAQYMVPALIGFVRQPAALLGLALTAVWIAPTLVPWALMVLPVGLLGARMSGRSVRGAAARWREARATLVALSTDALSQRQAIRDAAGEDAEVKRLRPTLGEERRARVSLETIRVAPRVVMRVIAGVALGGLLWSGGHAVLDGRLDPGSLVGFLICLALAARPLADIGEAWSLLQRASGALERVDEVLERPERPAPPVRPTRVPDGPLSLTWDDVSGGHAGQLVVSEVDITVPAGSSLAIMGPSGAGKTTLLDFATRQLDPVGGVVRIGGCDVRELDPRDLRRAVAIVRQDGPLLARSVRENLSMGRIVDDAVLWGALRLASAEFVTKLPQGLDTVLAEAGRSLSGGERQRLTVARAVASGARILLLDEPTSQVDPQTRDAIAAALRELRGDRTVVLVTHDSQLAGLADRLARLDTGRVSVAEPT